MNSANIARADSSLPPQKTWQPTHGIIFSTGPIPSTSRSLSTASEGIKQDLLLHSAAEDKYAMASKGVTAWEDGSVPNLAPTNSTDSKVPAPSNHPIQVKVEDAEQNEPPEPCYAFSIPPSIFRTAKNAAEGTPESFWTYALYRGPESKKPTVHYCKSVETTERVIQKYFANQKVIGFDIEWASDFIKYLRNPNHGPRKTLSLIQIASEDRIGLFHIALYPKRKNETPESFVAPALRKLMEDPGVSKLGVGIKADCTRLRKQLGINSQGLFELSHLYKLVKFSESKDTHLINKTLVSLATQVQEHLHLPLFKGDVRGSDWSGSLSWEQICYAASDPYAAVQLYYVLDAKRKRLQPTPTLPWHAELDLPIRVAEGIEIPTHDEGDDAGAVIKSCRGKSTRSPEKEQVTTVDDTIEPPLNLDPKPGLLQSIRNFSTRVHSQV